MIINALYKYYERLLDNPDSKISRPGFSKGKVGFCLVLDRSGELRDIIDLRVEHGHKPTAREIDVPEQEKKSINILANFMCGNCTYVLGLSQKHKKENKERNKKCFEEFVRLHKHILSELDDPGAAALLKFLQQWNLSTAASHPAVARNMSGLIEGSNIVFRLAGAEGYLHERKPVIAAWNRYKSSQSSPVIMQCLVTGRKTGIARLHPSIKGVTGAQTTGASLVSFNLSAFESYAKEQSFNAPVSEDAAFGYTTALNYLLSSTKNRGRIGDTTTVFWTDQSINDLAEDLLGALLFPQSDDNDSHQLVRDPQTLITVQHLFDRIKTGQPVNPALAGMDVNTTLYILGLAPNASRLAVRFWYMDDYIKIIEKISRHYSDLLLVSKSKKEPHLISLSMILKETALLKDFKNITPVLGGTLMRAILTDVPYPVSLFSSIISRIRTDQEINYVRAAVIKACLVRKRRYYHQGNEREITMALNEQNRNTGYLLGRLFALLERVQEHANPSIKTTIRNKYFGAASASPGTVFPILLRQVQHHIAEAEYSNYTDQRIEDIVSGIVRFPTRLSLEDQGQFVLGYYQQRQVLHLIPAPKGLLSNGRPN